MSAIKPAELRILEGNRGHRPIPDVVKPAPELSDPPKYFDALAIAEWHRLGGELFRLGLLTKLDKTAFEAYCWYYSQWRKSQKYAEEPKSETGQVNQLVWVEQKYFDKMKSIMVEFGMTPAARSRVANKSKDSEGDEFSETLD